MKSIGIYIIRGISLLFAVTIFAFILASVSPVDPIRQYIQANPGVSEENVLRMEEYWGLNALLCSVTAHGCPLYFTVTGDTPRHFDSR